MTQSRRLKGGVTIYLVDSGEVVLPADYRKVLSMEQLQKSDAFAFSWLKKRFLVGRYYLRYLLGAYLGEDPAKIVFCRGVNGRPQLGVDFPLCFSVSYSRTMIAIGIADGSLGVDIEFVNEEFGFTDIVSHYFSPKEAEFIVNSDNSADAFFMLWTRKEALLKGMGLGLVDDLHAVPSLDGTHLADLTTKGIPDADWTVHSYTYGTGSRISISYPDRMFEVCFCRLVADPSRIIF
ncbi:4'-phosphopantetheinyl transferase [Lunatimonas lonarensis]|uniref:4'-phosphopantetheinyl transferase n=1 Tax=Lunatimonas lonarensis TaxID=1232681 RepID=R7ZV35_9BACT|nr:4'-phosphopantetheinyl transferase [Lunatimonas lonarensis]